MEIAIAVLKQIRIKLETTHTHIHKKKVITATRVLHNIAMDSGIPVPEDGPGVGQQVQVPAAVPEHVAYDVT